MSRELRNARDSPQSLHLPWLVGPFGGSITHWCTQVSGGASTTGAASRWRLDAPEGLTLAVFGGASLALVAGFELAGRLPAGFTAAAARAILVVAAFDVATLAGLTFEAAELRAGASTALESGRLIFVGGEVLAAGFFADGFSDADLAGGLALGEAGRVGGRAETRRDAGLVREGMCGPSGPFT